MLTYFAVSTMTSSREAALSAVTQGDSRKPTSLGGSVTPDMLVDSHKVTETEDGQGVLAFTTRKQLHMTERLQEKDPSPQLDPRSGVHLGDLCCSN